MGNVVYQPLLTELEWEDAPINRLDVYRKYENAKEDFPMHNILAYSEEDIENPTIIDDERTPDFYVDVPNPDFTNEEWINVHSSKDRNECIEFAKKYYNADNNGMVSLISQS
jgi:hypothetical protein